MKRDPFEKQTDLSCRPLCISCNAMCEFHIAWKNPVNSKIEICCGCGSTPNIPDRNLAERSTSDKVHLRAYVCPLCPASCEAPGFRCDRGRDRFLRMRDRTAWAGGNDA